MLSHYCPPPIVFTLPCLSCNSLRKHSLPVGRRWPRIGFIVVQTDSPFQAVWCRRMVGLTEKIFAPVHFSLACRSDSCILPMRTRVISRSDRQRNGKREC